MTWNKLYANADSEAETRARLAQTIMDLDKITRRLAKDFRLTGGDGPLRGAYQKLLAARTEIAHHIAQAEGRRWGR